MHARFHLRLIRENFHTPALGPSAVKRSDGSVGQSLVRIGHLAMQHSVIDQVNGDEQDSQR